MDQPITSDTASSRGFSRRQTLSAGAVGTAALLAGGILAAPAADAATQSAATCEGFDAATKRVIAAILGSGMGAAQIPGMAVGIWVPRRGTYVTAMGTGDIATGKPLTLNDHFRIASISKTFTAHAVLRLVDQRRLSLQDKLETFVPGIPNGKRITVRQLLAMTSGIYDYVDDRDLTLRETADPLLPFSLADALAIIRRNEPLFEPGAQARYDNSNYYLLGAIVEKVTRTSLAKAIQSLVLTPLGLRHTSYPTTPAMPAPYSHGYLYQPNLGPRDVTASNPAFAGGAGAMISTLGDLKVWAKALATGALLKPATQRLRLQTRPLLQTPKITLGYGLGITDVNGFLGHDGAIVGYGSVMLYLPSRKATIVILGNSNDNGNPAPLNIGLSLASYLFPEQFPRGL